MNLFSIIVGAASILSFLFTSFTDAFGLRFALREALRAKKAAQQAEQSHQRAEESAKQVRDAAQRKTILEILFELTAQERQFRAFVDGSQWTSARQIVTQPRFQRGYLRTRYRNEIGIYACGVLGHVENEASSAFEILEQLSRRLPTEADLSQLHRLSYTIAVDMVEAKASINQTLERR